MIVYFSGTGNSQLAARQIAKVTGDEIISMNQTMKAGSKPVLHSERPLVFIVPTYGWRIPRVVERWIHSADITGCLDAYFVLTCGDGCGNAAAYARKLCTAAGLRFYGLASVVMPENYLALFPTPDQAQAQSILERAKPRIAALAAQIRDGELFAQEKISLLGRLESGPINPLFYRFFVSDRGFTVSDACISCGKCAMRCPLDNIKMTAGRPAWNGDCTHCMACIGGCPAEAIEYKRRSIGRSRYYIMEE